MLILDSNTDRSLQTYGNANQDANFSKDTINFDTAVESIQGQSAKVHIDTLSPFVGFGGGIYMMTVVKRMTAKDDFIKMPLKEKNCEVELTV